MIEMQYGGLVEKREMYVKILFNDAELGVHLMAVPFCPNQEFGVVEGN